MTEAQTASTVVSMTGTDDKGKILVSVSFPTIPAWMVWNVAKNLAKSSQPTVRTMGYEIGIQCLTLQASTGEISTDTFAKRRDELQQETL